jgi:putative ABC transport system ATP-binding protein
MAEESVSIDSKDLEKFEIFKGLSQSQVDELYVWLQRRDFHAGDHIFEEGQQTNGLYLLTGGTVSVVKKSTYGKVKLTEIKAPSFFGEMGLLAGGLRTAGVRAVTPVVAGFLPCEVFERKLADSNMTALRIGVNIGRILCLRLGDTSGLLATQTALIARKITKVSK